MRNRLLAAARRIAANRNEQPVSKFVAFRKLFVQERRDWKRPGAPRIGWKRGELAEVAQALLARDTKAARDEWGDCGYYIAQSFDWLWSLYAAITPESVIQSTAEKFDRRANKEK
jgi:NTP pyrophosphatase (non-canonical NTP hydrolase)